MRFLFIFFYSVRRKKILSRYSTQGMIGGLQRGSKDDVYGR